MRKIDLINEASKNEFIIFGDFGYDGLFWGTKGWGDGSEKDDPTYAFKTELEAKNAIKDLNLSKIGKLNGKAPKISILRNNNYSTNVVPFTVKKSSFDKDPFDKVTQTDVKKAFLKYVGISEKEITPERQHQHKYNYVPVFDYNPKAETLHVKFDFGKTTKADGKGTYTSVFSFIHEDNGKFMVGFTIDVSKNNYENTTIKSKYIIDYKTFNTFNEARKELFNEIGL